MATSQRRLGRGLSSILSIDPPAGSPAQGQQAAPPNMPFIMVPVEQLRPNPFQPRQEMPPEDLAKLAESIRKTGVIQPITARASGTNAYEIVAGERRWRAAQMAGLTQVPAYLREASDQELLEMALVENIFREDLNPVERAYAYQRYCKEFDLSPEEVAQRLGEDRTTVTNYIRILELPADVKHMLSRRELSMGHARSLLGLRNSTEIVRLAEQVSREGLSVRAVEKMVQQRLAARESAHRAPTEAESSKRPLIKELEQSFTQSLGCRVEIGESRKRGRGKIVIQYASLDDFDRICQRLGVELPKQ